MKNIILKFMLAFSLVSLPSMSIPSVTMAQMAITPDFSEFKGINCQIAEKWMIMGDFGGWKISSDPRKKFEQVNYTVCFPTMLLCRNWLLELEKIYTIRPPYQETCLRDRL